MSKHVVFKIGSKKVGIKYTEEVIFEPTLINKSFVDDNGREFINYKREKVEVIDTSKRLFGEPMKKFDGLLFIISGDRKVALKTESFFKYDEPYDVEFDLDYLFESVREKIF